MILRSNIIQYSDYTYCVTLKGFSQLVAVDFVREVQIFCIAVHMHKLNNDNYEYRLENIELYMAF